MLTNIFDFLEKIKSGISKPDARITVEVCDMGNGKGLKFQFLWYEDKLEKLSLFIPKEMVDSTFDEASLVEYITYKANFQLANQE